MRGISKRRWRGWGFNFFAIKSRYEVYKHNPSPTFHSYILDFCDVHVRSPLPPTFSLLPTSPLPPLHPYLPCKAFPHCGFWCWPGFFNFCVWRSTCSISFHAGNSKGVIFVALTQWWEAPNLEILNWNLHSHLGLGSAQNSVTPDIEPQSLCDALQKLWTDRTGRPFWCVTGGWSGQYSSTAGEVAPHAQRVPRIECRAFVC